jgi:hypothetical protein
VAREERALRHKLSYGNITATLALFVSLGGISYAAVQLPSGSVGTQQLKREAVSTGKLKSGAVTETKLADGAVTGPKVDTATLGMVPSAGHAVEADHALRADSASRASSAAIADMASNSSRLDGSLANAYGAAVIAHTEIPATNTDATWWVPVNGIGEPGDTIGEVEMLTPSTTPLFGTGFTAMSKSGPGPDDDARVYVQLFHDEESVAPSLPITRLAYGYWQADSWVKVEAGGRLAIKVTETANGEEIPALSLQTALLLSPSL